MQPTLEQITAAVSDYMKVPVSEIMGKGRSESIAIARMLCYHFARIYTGKTFLEIGIFFKKNHSAIVYGCESIMEKCETNSEFNSTVIAIGQKIEGVLTPQEEEIKTLRNCLRNIAIIRAADNWDDLNKVQLFFRQIKQNQTAGEIIDRELRIAGILP